MFALFEAVGVSVTLIVWSAIYSGTDRDIHARFLNATGSEFVTSHYRAVDGTSARAAARKETGGRPERMRTRSPIVSRPP